MSAPHEQGALGPESKTKVLWSAWPEDDCDSDPRIDPMAQKVTEWFVGRWPIGADEPECRILVGEGRSAEIVARRIAEKLTSVLNTDAILAREAASAPASGAERMTAGEGRSREDCADLVERAIKLAEANGLDRVEMGGSLIHWRSILTYLRATLAPATPPGVPDSVRVLSEAASPDWDTNDATPYILGPSIDGEIDRFEVIARGPHGHAKSGDAIRKWQANRMFAVAAVNYVRALLSTHPAGQSTGQGAEDQRPLRMRLADTILNGIHMGQEGAFTDINKTLDDVLALFAPDSTRTGDEGTEDAEQRITNLANALASARRQRGEQERRAIAAEQRIIELEQGKIHPALAVDVQEHRNQAYQTGWDDGYAEGHGKATADALAARPASPEAQGAWSFDMEAAPRDGTPLLCVEYDEPKKVVDLHWFRDGGTASSWRGSFGQQRRPIAWCRLPAPPSSSGQGGR